MSMAMLCRLLRAHVMPAHREIMSLIPQKQVNIIHVRDSFTITPALVIGSQLEPSQHDFTVKPISLLVYLSLSP